MRLRLERVAKRSTYTIGHLYDVTGGRRVYLCDTLEDRVRDLSKEKKVKGSTAIPAGTYRVVMGYKSPKFSNYTKYPWAKKYGGRLPRLLDVPQFDGILMHPGASAAHTDGCVLVGENKVVGGLVNSRATFERLMDDWLVPCYRRKDNDSGLKR